MEKVPIRRLDLTLPADRARHDKMVALVDKMLVLMPKLRAAKSEQERKTLQNAVDATDRQIDELVYELYGLTKDEIARVELESN
jgi:Xaa-Pro aminopeptidase